jgi:hypothetical protein
VFSPEIFTDNRETFLLWGLSLLEYLSAFGEGGIPSQGV